MRGEFIGVWSETWREIWDVLASHEAAPGDLFCELYRELAAALNAKPSAQELADIIDDPVQSRVAFQNTKGDHLSGERGLATFLESAHATLDDFGWRSSFQSLFQPAHCFHRQVQPALRPSAALHAVPDAAGCVRQPCARSA